MVCPFHTDIVQGGKSKFITSRFRRYDELTRQSYFTRYSMKTNCHPELYAKDLAADRSLIRPAFVSFR